MKNRFFWKSFVTAALILMYAVILPGKPQRQTMYMNFQKLVLYHSQSTNEYYLVVTATDDSCRMANFDELNVHVKLKMRDGEERMIDNEDLKVTCLGNMYSKVIGDRTTLFRFNLIIDNSGSIDQQSLSYVQHALTKFIKLVPLVFEGQIIRFATTVQLKSNFTKDKDQLVRDINQPMERGGTALFDAIDIGIQELKSKKDNIPLRFAVVLTDGRNNASVKNPDPTAFKSKIISECRKYYIPLFIVGVTNSVDSQLMTEIAKFGFYQHIRRFPDIDKAFQVILNFIKDTYVFKIPAVGKFQDIKTLYLVKKTPGGNFETIQDVFVH